MYVLSVISFASCICSFFITELSFFFLSPRSSYIYIALHNLSNDDFFVVALAEKKKRKEDVYIYLFSSFV